MLFWSPADATSTSDLSLESFRVCPLGIQVAVLTVRLQFLQETIHSSLADRYIYYNCTSKFIQLDLLKEVTNSNREIFGFSILVYYMYMHMLQLQ